MNIFFDIETIFTQDGRKADYLVDEVKAPSKMSRPETIDAWEKSTSETWGRAADEKAAITKSSLDGAFGEICAIAFAADSTDPAVTVRNDARSEADIIKGFFDAVTMLAQGNLSQDITLIGHNIYGFDMQFIMHRCAVLGIRLPLWWPHDMRPYSKSFYDTMLRWDARNFISLDRLCMALGLDGKSDIDGSMIADLWQAGDYQKIADYACDDVIKVREVWRKMSEARL